MISIEREKFERNSISQWPLLGWRKFNGLCQENEGKEGGKKGQHIIHNKFKWKDFEALPW